MLFLCLKIFCVRIIDVSLGTIRTIMSVKNKNFIASLIGFFEVTVWFLIVREALNTNDKSFFIAFSYALGFSVGTFIGGVISNKYITGYITVNVITNTKDELLSTLKSNGYGVSIVDLDNGMYLFIIQINNNSFNKLKSTILKFDKKAFIVVNDTKYVQNGFIK